MSDSKVFMFPEQGSNNSGLMSLLGPMLSLKGIDPGVLALMKNNNGFGGEGGWFMWVIFLFFLMGWGGNGWGGFGNRQATTQGVDYLSTQINNDAGRELLMQAINGNGNAVNQLASTLNCSVGNIQSALNGVMSLIQSVGNQVGMSSQQVINAVQSGDCAIANQISSACCNVTNAITRLGYENQLATCQLTNNITSAINSNSIALRDGASANTNAILGKLDAMQTLSLYDKIDALRESKSQLQTQLSQQIQTATFGLMISQAVTPINTSLCDLSSRLASIECNQPLVAKVPYTPAMGGFIPFNYGANGISTLSTLSGGCNC